jgi:type IV pilus assembly protein PilY1
LTPDKKVLWEITDKNDPTLGVTLGQATIARTENNSALLVPNSLVNGSDKMTRGGRWVALFGNGYNSEGDSGDSATSTEFDTPGFNAADPQQARLFIVDLQTGKILRRLDTKSGGSATPNGLSTPVALDLNGNGAVDWVYAGDMLGNLWKFDLSSDNPMDWKVGNGGHPVLTAKDAAKKRQPITAKPNAMRHNNGIMVYFGTGQFFEMGDQENVAPQTFYGVFDACGATAGCTQATLSRIGLLEQKLTPLGPDYRVLENNSIDFTLKKGFFIDLPDGGERALSQPLIWTDRIIFNTIVPVLPAGTDICAVGGSVGWLMEISPFSGGKLAFSVFDSNGDRQINAGDNGASGKRTQGGTGITVVQGSDKTFKFVGGEKIDNISPAKGRQSWRRVN